MYKRQSIGKASGGSISHSAVTYYPLLVTEQSDSWPEDTKRQRHWALLDDAALVTDRDDLRQLIRQFESIEQWIKEDATHRKAKLTAALTPAQ